MLKVSVVESFRLGCLLVYGDSASRRWGWSLCLVQIIGIAVWSGCRCCWRCLMMWMHWLLRLDDRCLSLFNPWLTECMSMQPQSVDASPSCVISHGLGVTDAVAWLHRNSCCVKLELVCSWYCMLCGYLVVSARKVCSEETRGGLERLSEVSFYKSYLNERAAVIGLWSMLGLQLWLVAFPVIYFGWW